MLACVEDYLADRFQDQITLRLPLRLRCELEDVARAERRSVAALVRIAVVHELASREAMRVSVPNDHEPDQARLAEKVGNHAAQPPE